MNDFATQKTTGNQNHFDFVRRIETMSGEIPYAVKQLKDQVSDFIAADKKLTSFKAKVEKKATSRALNKLDDMINEYKVAYRKCRQNYGSINSALEEIASLYSKLSSYYYSQGKGREAKRVINDGEKFDKATRKQLNTIMGKFDSAKEASIAEEDLKETMARREEGFKNTAATEDGAYKEAHAESGAQRRYSASQNQQGYPAYDYRTPPPYYQPMPSFNIAPISIDVNSAVKSAVDSFTKAFEEKIEEYLLAYSAKSEKSGVSEAEGLALDKIAEDESFTLGKISELLEKIAMMMSTLSDLTAKYSELEEKTALLADSMKSVTDTQRTLARELQGVQATQKVISGDQLKLLEEQAVVFEEQKAALSRQLELKNVNDGVTDEVNTALDYAVKTLDGFKSCATQQNEILKSMDEITSSSSKLFELQRNLEERQSELTEMQRDALLAQKKLMRSQKAVNERSGARQKSQKEEKPEEILAVD